MKWFPAFFIVIFEISFVSIMKQDFFKINHSYLILRVSLCVMLFHFILHQRLVYFIFLTCHCVWGDGWPPVGSISHHTKDFRHLNHYYFYFYVIFRKITEKGALSIVAQRSKYMSERAFPFEAATKAGIWAETSTGRSKSKHKKHMSNNFYKVSVPQSGVIQVRYFPSWHI